MRRPHETDAVADVVVRRPPAPPSPASSMLLQTWLSPAFPVGGFAYSHGLESAVDAGDVDDAASLRQWLLDLLEHGAVRNDLVLLAAAWRAAATQDDATLVDVNDLALALAPSRERHLETVSQGNAFVAAARGAFACGTLDRLAAVAPEHVAYPVAVACAAAGHGVALDETCRAFGLAFISALVSATVRLGPIGQSEGLAIVAALMPQIEIVSIEACASTLDDLGSAAFRSDIASMRHETLYSRLFRS